MGWTMGQSAINVITVDSPCIINMQGSHGSLKFLKAPEFCTSGLSGSVG